MKTCTTCHIEKDENLFYTRENVNKSKAVYRKSMCIECTKKAVNDWKLANIERFRKYQREYQKAHYNDK